MHPDLPTYADVAAARQRLTSAATETPLLENAALNERLGGRLLVKAEALQRTGSFKFRGAYNRITLIPEGDRHRGVVAYSSGNHAQGVAAAARLHGIPATIVMPVDAPAIKRRNTQALGASVIPYDRTDRNGRERIGQDVVDRTGATLVKPFDDPGIVAGQGTTGLEIAEQCRALGIEPEAVIVPCGGGGLASGIALALGHQLPNTELYTAEPVGHDDAARSWTTGTHQKNENGPASICDALMAPSTGDIPYDILVRHVAGGFAVSDDWTQKAMATAFDRLKLVVEPGGAVAIAAVLSGAYPIEGRTVVVVASGGNVDPAQFAEALQVHPI